MKRAKIYEATDKMIDLIRDNYNILQSLSSFGIALGFGDKTVDETCQEANVDTATFLTIVNHTINGQASVATDHLSIPTLLHYLSACHRYFLDYQLPFVRRNLSEAVNADDSIGRLILQVYDTYARDLRRHMKYEEQMLFPYVENLLNGQLSSGYSIEDFVKHHTEADKSLKELKNLIIKYMPSTSTGSDSNPLISTLFLIYNNEEWLNDHQDVEDSIFVPLIRKLEQSLKTERINTAISAFANAAPSENKEAVTEREKDVIISIVQGMSNKEIADHLFISVNTVITHRKNIARKLQIHSPAGLTIYAIANGLVDIGSLRK